MFSTIRRAMGAHRGGIGGLATEVLGLVALDVFKPVDDPTSDLQVSEAFPDPAPPLERPGRDVPAVGQLDPIEMAGGHSCLLQWLRKPAELGRDEGRVDGGEGEESREELTLSYYISDI